MKQMQTVMTYFEDVGAPKVFAVPNISCFGMEGPGADGLEQGAVINFVSIGNSSLGSSTYYVKLFTV